MSNKQWGDPVITLRLPAWQIAGLKRIAADSNSTVSALIREQIDTLLYVNGFSAGNTASTLDGQVSVKDLNV